MTIEIKQEAQIYGEYQMIVLDKDGNVKTDTGWFKNMLLDNFFDAITAGNWTTSSMWYPSYSQRNLRVGTGALAPQPTETQLGSLVASTNSRTTLVTKGFTQAGEIVHVDTDMLWSVWEDTFTFTLGQVVGNLTEVGAYFGNNSSTLVHSRSLIKDSNGDPTTLTVTAQDQLVVKYRLTLNNINSTGTGTITLDGSNYTWDSRRYKSYQDSEGGWFQTLLAPTNGSVNTYYGQCFLNSFGLPLTGFTATGQQVDATTLVSSVRGQRKHRIVWTVPQGNHANGIGGICTVDSSSPHWGGKVIFTPPIPKTAAQQLTLEFTYDFTRG